MSDDDLIRRGDARQAVIDSHSAMDAVVRINALSADMRAWGYVKEMPKSEHDAGDALSAALALPEVHALVEALRDISRQKKTDELVTEYDVEFADFEGGYDACINRANALAAVKGGE